jgi:predicted MPP superfamily phosphohydrolase
VKFILSIIGSMIALDAAWWTFSSGLAKRRHWRLITAAFIVGQLVALIYIVSGRILHIGWDRALPKFVSVAVFIWHFFGLAALLVIGVVIVAARLIPRIVRFLVPSGGVRPSQDKTALTRREFLGIAAALAPPLFTLSLGSIAMAQLSSFRVRRFIVTIPGLPRDLHGLTIAQVSDMHVGRFTSGQILREMVKTTNELRADLVVLTGDLINDALADLSEGLDLVRAMQGRFGLWMIEGNHDLIENGAEFERRAKQSGVPFLLNESALVTVRGCPMQILGLPWTRGGGDHRDEVISASVRKLVKQRQEEAFPILLAHHPHAFDAAVEAELPLVLSGHTHGGQLMLNERCGFGPVLFRYWSGHYARGRSRMIVSNGVGNWFPLRINAPAEIVHITLRSDAA